MTRVKKTRSLKRIHKVKTGSASKLKRQARTEGHDRQSAGKRQKDKKLSVYEKFLQEHPEAKVKQSQAAKKAPVKNTDEKVKEQDKEKDNKSLLDQLDDKDFGDIY